MYKYLAKRILQMAITLLLFQAATYFLIDAQPGDITDKWLANPDIPPYVRDQIRAELGLDRPPAERFVTYIGNFYRGNLGLSFSYYPRPVIDVVMERLPRTIVLFLSATLVSFWAGFLTGKVLAWRRGGWVEYSATISGVMLYTVFTPWFALMMIWLFAVQLDWLPAGKFLDPVKWLDASVDANYVFTRMFNTGMILLLMILVGLIYSNRLRGQVRAAFRAAILLVPMIGAFAYWQSSGVAHLAVDIASHLILPVLTLTLISYAGMMLLTRTSMLETLREDYIQTARAKGLPAKVVRDKHAARNALLPVWTSLVFSLANTVGGGIITESVFSWPGIGQSLLNSALQSDIPLAMATLTILGVLTLVGHLVVDIGYVYLDPRIRYRGE